MTKSICQKMTISNSECLLLQEKEKCVNRSVASVRRSARSQVAFSSSRGKLIPGLRCIPPGVNGAPFLSLSPTGPNRHQLDKRFLRHEHKHAGDCSQILAILNTL